jgi:hypothetical protein
MKTEARDALLYAGLGVGLTTQPSPVVGMRAAAWLGTGLATHPSRGTRPSSIVSIGERQTRSRLWERRGSDKLTEQVACRMPNVVRLATGMRGS